MPIGRLNTTQSRVNVPIGTFADKLMQYGRQQEAKALQEQQMTKEDERFQTNLGFKNRQEGRLISKIQTDGDKELANNEAMGVILHPEKYSQEQRASILGNSHVDQSKLFNTETALYKRNAMTPGTAEYEAKLEAEVNKTKRLGDLTQRYAKELMQGRQTFQHEEGVLSRAFQSGQQNQRIGAADNRLTRQLTAKATAVSNKKREEATKVQIYRDMLNVSPTQQVGKVVNQVAIDNIGDNQIKYGNAYTDFMNKAGFADLDGKRVELSNKLNTVTDPKAKAVLGRELDTVTKRLGSIKTAANQVGNTAVGSIGLQDLPKPVIKQETKQKPREQYVKELTGIIPEGMASADVYKGAESLINKNYKKLDQTAEGYKRTIELYGGKVPETNDPKVLEAVAKSILKQNEKRTGTSKGKRGTVGSKTVKAMTDMFKDVGTADFVGTGSGDSKDMIDRMVKMMEDSNIPDSVMSEFITMAQPKFDGPLWFVNDGKDDDFEKEVKRLVDRYNTKSK